MKYIIDCGHGGVAFGHYLTLGKRSFSDDLIFYEGEFNRAVAGYIEAVTAMTIDVEILNPGPINIPLRDRISYINELYEKMGRHNLTCISIHANADGKASYTRPWTMAKGHTVFIAKRASLKSYKLAEKIDHELSRTWGAAHSRGVKTKNFAMVKKVKCPAVLVECGFMTNEDDCRFMDSKQGRMRIAKAISHALLGVRSLITMWGE